MKTNTTTGNAPLGEEESAIKLICEYREGDCSNEAVSDALDRLLSDHEAELRGIKENEEKTSGKQEAVTESVEQFPEPHWKMICELWDDDIKQVEKWLHDNHPEFITDSGMTCWGNLLESLASVPVAGAPVEQTESFAPFFEHLKGVSNAELEAAVEQTDSEGKEA